MRDRTSSFVFLGWLLFAGGGVLPERSRPEKPFIKSPAAPPPLTPLDDGCAAPESPKTPSKSSRLLLASGCGAGAPTAGDCTRTGVPARPSKPPVASPCEDAGTPPSKSISSRFSTLFCACAEGVVPLTAAAAAAAKGFSRAFWICSLH